MGSITSQNLRAMNLADGLRLRPAQAADRAFMQELFRSTRGYLYSIPMLRQQIDYLVAQQYQLQQASYARQWPDAQTMIIERSGQAIGKIMLNEGEAVVHIIDFVIEPGLRGKGCGTAILQALQFAAGKRLIRLSVDRQNPGAKKLYLRLGFQMDGTSDTHESMIWPPAISCVNADSVNVSVTV